MVFVAAFYRFARLPDPAALRDRVAAVCAREGLMGTVLLASEGVNATVAGPRAGIDALLTRLSEVPGLDALAPRWSQAARAPFGRMKVRLKREIVTMGRPGLGAGRVGRRVAPEAWNDVLRDPSTVTVDVRNAAEVALGSFEGAVDPGTARFGAFPDWWAAHAPRMSGRRVAMFCTGGIRCEKATALALEVGASDVVHLDGGILAYLEAIPEERSLWRGACYVFDDRVSVRHGLHVGDDVMCHACRQPLSRAATRHPAYEAGVSCPRCIDAFDAADRTRFRERMRQMSLAEARGDRHLGRSTG